MDSEPVLLPLPQEACIALVSEADLNNENNNNNNEIIKSGGRYAVAKKNIAPGELVLLSLDAQTVWHPNVSYAPLFMMAHLLEENTNHNFNFDVLNEKSEIIFQNNNENENNFDLEEIPRTTHNTVCSQCFKHIPKKSYFINFHAIKNLANEICISREELFNTIHNNNSNWNEMLEKIKEMLKNNKNNNNTENETNNNNENQSEESEEDIENNNNKTKKEAKKAKKIPVSKNKEKRLELLLEKSITYRENILYCYKKKLKEFLKNNENENKYYFPHKIAEIDTKEALKAYTDTFQQRFSKLIDFILNENNKNNNNSIFMGCEGCGVHGYCSMACYLDHKNINHPKKNENNENNFIISTSLEEHILYKKECLTLKTLFPLLMYEYSVKPKIKKNNKNNGLELFQNNKVYSFFYDYVFENFLRNQNNNNNNNNNSQFLSAATPWSEFLHWHCVSRKLNDNNNNYSKTNEFYYLLYTSLLWMRKYKEYGFIQLENNKTNENENSENNYNKKEENEKSEENINNNNNNNMNGELKWIETIKKEKNLIDKVEIMDTEINENNPKKRFADIPLTAFENCYDNENNNINFNNYYYRVPRPSYGDAAALVSNISILKKEQKNIYIFYYRKFLKIVFPLLFLLFQKINHNNNNLNILIPKKELFIQLCAASQCNAFGIFHFQNNNNNNKNEKNSNNPIHNKEDPLAVGLYPFASYFNHSCTPNVCRVVFYENNNNKTEKNNNDQRVFSFFALRPIQKNELMTICYINVEEENKNTRQQILLNSYRFWCLCPRCNHQNNKNHENKNSENKHNNLKNLTFRIKEDLCEECPYKGYLRPLRPFILNHNNNENENSENNNNNNIISIRECNVCGHRQYSE